MPSRLPWNHALEVRYGGLSGSLRAQANREILAAKFSHPSAGCPD